MKVVDTLLPLEEVAFDELAVGDLFGDGGDNTCLKVTEHIAFVLNYNKPCLYQASVSVIRLPAKSHITLEQT
jgi:hypothetical protein